MFYVVMVPPVLMLVYMVWWIRSVKRHDKVLYRFCELRRETMLLLRNEADVMTENDYTATRDILHVASYAIHSYDANASALFNFRKYRAFVREFRTAAHQVELIATSTDPRIQDLDRKLEIAMLLGFASYTPFLFTEMLLRLGVYIARLLAYVGLKKVYRFLSAVYEAVTLAQNRADQLNISLRHSH